MSDIVGTTTSVLNYLSKAEVKLTINPNSKNERTITLPENRKYIIPAYQREIRWNSGNVNVLLSDLVSGPKFLGNIIISLKSENECEIIDGQQRTTIIQMILSCIRGKYGDEIELFEISDLENKSFGGLGELINYCFDESKMDAEKVKDIKNSDDYLQFNRIKQLWGILSNSQIINNRYQAKKLVDNLKKSEVNILASHAEADDQSIKYFLDVNLKGVRLDKEDIFKGYLFGEDSRPETKKLWQENKKLSIKLNEIKGGKEEKRYPLMKIYEHFLYCDLFMPKSNGQDFSAVSFGEDFCLSQAATIQSQEFYEGTHIIEVIQNAQYLQNTLKRIKLCLETMIDVAETEGPSDTFKKQFILDSKDQIDSVDIENIHCILKKIVLDKEIIPKVLLIKYLISVFDGKSHSKEEYRAAYTIFTAATVFTVFADKKASTTFYTIVKDKSWVSNLNKSVSAFVRSHLLTRGKVLAAYKFSEGSDNSKEEQIRCKALAAVCNFIRIRQVSKEEYKLSVTNFKQFNLFLTNKQNYSIEHFVIGNNGTLTIAPSKHGFDKHPYEYPRTIKKYRNSIFNYIFIPEDLNNLLENTLLGDKLQVLSEHLEDISCSYSRAYIDLMNKPRFFSKYPTREMVEAQESREEAVKLLNEYFLNTFPSDLLYFATELANKFTF